MPKYKWFHCYKCKLKFADMKDWIKHGEDFHIGKNKRKVNKMKVKKPKRRITVNEAGGDYMSKAKATAEIKKMIKRGDSKSDINKMKKYYFGKGGIYGK